MSEQNTKKLRIFFDGTCGLCHRFVYFILCKMKREVFIFTSQESPIFFEKTGLKANESDSIVVCIEEKNQCFYKGEAVRLILMQLKQPWKWAAFVLYCLPLPFLNVCYDCTAKFRHAFFKKKQSCPLVPGKWVKFFDD